MERSGVAAPGAHDSTKKAAFGRPFLSVLSRSSEVVQREAKGGLFVDCSRWMIHALLMMTFRQTALVFSCALVFIACGGSQKKVERNDDTLVPEETQERSRDQYGKQQMRMDELGSTTSEQAATRHENATRPVKSEKYGRDKDKKRN